MIQIVLDLLPITEEQLMWERIYDRAALIAGLVIVAVIAVAIIFRKLRK